MKAWLLVTAVVIGLLLAAIYFFVLPQAVEQRAQIITHDVQMAYDKQVAACTALAQRAYLRDFVIICNRSQTLAASSSVSASSTSACRNDLNAAVAYGVYEGSQHPTSDLTKLYAVYKDDVASCSTQ